MGMYAWLHILAAVAAAANVGEWNVVKAGAVPDGKTDCTAIFQRLLDDAMAAGGGIVNVPAGDFCIKGNLKIPGGVTLQGTFRVPPTNDHETRPRMDGSVLLAYPGRGTPDGPAFITMAGSNATLAGFIIRYPEWKQTDVPPVAYPPTISADYMADVGILDCCLLNAYEGIHFQNTGRFLVRGVYGYPSFRGLYVDNCCDIGRVENCHFWPFGVLYKPDDPYCLWVNSNGVAFEFARTDWQYVLNTFCFGYGVGYKFSETPNGSCNGNFLGLGADCCRRPVLVEQAQFPGLLITNGEFVGRWTSADSVGIEIGEKASGKVSLNNCSFWGPVDRCIWNRSAKAQLTVIGTHFFSWNVEGTGAPAIQLDAGKAIIQGNTFGAGETHVQVGANVKSAILMGNQAVDGFVAENHAGARMQFAANEPRGFEWPKGAAAHYQLLIGEPGDHPYIKLWHEREKALEWPNAPGAKRWSTAESQLRLPVLPRKAYTATVQVYVPKFAIDPNNGLYLGQTRLAEFPAQEGPAVVTAVIPGSKQNEVVLTVRAKAWCPKDVYPGSDDFRRLGVGVRSVVMQAQGAGTTMFNANTGEGNE